MYRTLNVSVPVGGMRNPEMYRAARFLHERYAIIKEPIVSIVEADPDVQPPSRHQFPPTDRTPWDDPLSNVTVQPLPYETQRRLDRDIRNFTNSSFNSVSLQLIGNTDHFGYHHNFVLPSEEGVQQEQAAEEEDHDEHNESEHDSEEENDERIPRRIASPSPWIDCQSLQDRIQMATILRNLRLSQNEHQREFERWQAQQWLQRSQAGNPGRAEGLNETPVLPAYNIDLSQVIRWDEMHECVDLRYFLDMILAGSRLRPDLQSTEGSRTLPSDVEIPSNYAGRPRTADSDLEVSARSTLSLVIEELQEQSGRASPQPHLAHDTENNDGLSELAPHANRDYCQSLHCDNEGCHTFYVTWGPLASVVDREASPSSLGCGEVCLILEATDGSLHQVAFQILYEQVMKACRPEIAIHDEPSEDSYTIPTKVVVGKRPNSSSIRWTRTDRRDADIRLPLRVWRGLMHADMHDEIRAWARTVFGKEYSRDYPIGSTPIDGCFKKGSGNRQSEEPLTRVVHNGVEAPTGPKAGRATESGQSSRGGSRGRSRPYRGRGRGRGRL